jgi:hypothetical protein
MIFICPLEFFMNTFLGFLIAISYPLVAIVCFVGLLFADSHPFVLITILSVFVGVVVVCSLLRVEIDNLGIAIAPYLSFVIIVHSILLISAFVFGDVSNIFTYKMLFLEVSLCLLVTSVFCYYVEKVHMPKMHVLYL